MPAEGSERPRGEAGDADGAPLADAADDSMTDVVEVLRAELQSIRDRGGSEAPTTESAGDGVPPPPPPSPGDDAGLRAQLARLEQALTEGLAWMPPSLPEGLADRADIVRLSAQIERMGTSAGRGEVDLQPLQDHLERLHEQLDALAHRVAAAPAPDLGAVEAQLQRLGQRLDSLPGRDQLARTLAPQLDAILSAARPDDVLDAIDVAARSLRDQVTAIGDLSPAVRRAIAPVSAQLDQLVASDAAMHDDLALTSEVLVGLTRLTEATEAHLADLASQPAADRQALANGAVKDVAQNLSRQLRQLEAGVQGLAAQVGDVGDGISAHLDAASDELRSLDVASLRATMTELVQHVVDGRAQDRELLEAVLTLDERVAELHDTALLAPTALAEAPPGRSLASADDLAETRASLAEDLAETRSSVAEAIAALGAHLTAEQQAVEVRLAELLQPPPDAPDPDPVLAEVQAAVVGLTAELAGLRSAFERRPTGRRRRRDGEVPVVEPPAVAPSDLERRVDHALAAMDGRLAALADQVDAAAEHAREAATAARAALTGLTRASRTAPPPPPPPPATPPARRPAKVAAQATKVAKTAKATTTAKATKSARATKTAKAGKAAAASATKKASSRTRS